MRDSVAQRIVVKSKIANVSNATEYRLYNTSEFASEFGRSFSPYSDAVLIMDGDGWNSNLVVGSKWKSNDGLYVTFSKSVNGGMRFNVVAIFES